MSKLVDGHPVIVVNDAYRIVPDAAILYACDAAWWRARNGVPGFSGERWSTHDEKSNEKIAEAEKYNLTLVEGRGARGLSNDCAFINYGQNSGFQALNLAVLMGASTVILFGFDLRDDRPRHFFGDHEPPLRNPTNFKSFIAEFDYASKHLPDGVTILNATPGSALKCFEQVSLEDAETYLAGNYGHCVEPVAYQSGISA